jgi:hypothetical protein
MAFNGKAPYAPEYASYNWIGAPANYDLSTNADLGGDSRMQLSEISLHSFQFLTWRFFQELKM